jgi:uncharacterized membrane protein YfcA
MLVCALVILVLGLGSGFVCATLGVPLWAYILLMILGVALWSYAGDQAAAKKQAEQAALDAAKDQALNEALEELTRLKNG